MANLKRKIALGLLILFAAAALMVAPLLRFKDPTDSGRADFMGFYLGGRIVNQGPRSQLYNEDFQLALRQNLFGPCVGVDAFLHPPFEALFFSPLARLPYPAAYISWDLISLALLALSLYLLRPFVLNLDSESRLIFTLALAVPLISTLAEGQDSILLLLLYVLAFVNMKKGRDLWAGLALGASLFRFQLTIPFLLIFLVRRHWKVPLGASAVGAVLGLTSFLLVGWTGMLGYAHLLLARTGGGYYPAKQMPTVRGFIDTLFANPSISQLATGHFATVLVIISSLSLLAWVFWKWADKPRNPLANDFDLLFSLNLVVAFLLSFHSLVHTLVVLALPMLLLLDRWAANASQGSRRWLTVAPLILLFVTAVIVSIVTVNEFTYLFPAVVLFAAAISAQISRPALERGPSPEARSETFAQV